MIHKGYKFHGYGTTLRLSFSIEATKALGRLANSLHFGFFHLMQASPDSYRQHKVKNMMTMKKK